MGLFKSLLDKVKGAQEDLEKKAAKKAGEVALQQGAKAAKNAIDAAGNAIERAIFGDVEGDAKTSPIEPPDPFAKVKADAAAKKERDAELRAKERDEQRRAKERAAREAKVEREVDDELAAMKKRLGK